MPTRYKHAVCVISYRAVFRLPPNPASCLILVECSCLVLTRLLGVQRSRNPCCWVSLFLGGAPALLHSLAYWGIFQTRSFPRCYSLTKVGPQGQVVVGPQSESRPLQYTQGQAPPELQHCKH